ncbi:MAG: class I tRNA ligase family protein [Patescibacteria group bacterium]
MSFKKVESQVNFPKMEEEILTFWDEHKIFEKSLKKDSPQGDFIFYEGPPTANGKPGLHHVLARAFKDIIPRYKTMKGYHVERKAGWDTHGLPVELQVEKGLGLKNKQDIENIVPGEARASIIRFNEECKKSVWEYRDLWEKMTKRMGYWVDMEHPYVTYENEYIESVWWQLAQIAELKNAKGESFLYKGHKVVPYCYRCGTTLSSHEVAQGYQTVKDNSVVAKFELTDEPGTYLLAWTTTPWTLPGNVALAVGKDIQYMKVVSDGTKYIIAKELAEKVFAGKEFQIEKEITSNELVGRSYKPLFDHYLDTNKDLLRKRKVDNGEKDVVVLAVFNGKGEVLLGYRNYTKDTSVDRDFWIAPGGKAEIGETMEDAIRRELKEECNIESYKIKKYLGSYQGYSKDHNLFCYLLEIGNIDQIQNNEPEKFAEWKFFSSDTLPVNEFPNTEDDRKFFLEALNWHNAYKIYAADFVTTEDGTGVVHIAPAFGEDDANVGKENDLPTLLTVEADGTLSKGLGLPGEGIPVKKKNDKNRYAVDDLIIEDLKKRNLFFKEEMYEHEYPFCWRCDTPLIYYAKPSWFIRMSEVRDALVENNEKITWVPEHTKEGRFGEWLRGAKDWAISRERYWGTPLPIWECEKCDARKVISSIGELTKLSGKTLEDVHKPYIDDATFACECGGTMRRTPEVLDVWFDSGAMPLAQFGYPHTVEQEAKKNIETGKYFPADYICEAIDQTRGWFYTLHAIATLLNQSGKVHAGNAYKNVICLGHILDAQGKKMSKSKGNVIDPFQMFEEFGADPLRWMLFSINQPGLPKRFDIKGMRDVQNRVFRMLWNSYSFFVTYVSIDKWEPKELEESPKKIYDRWILAELQELVKEVTKALDAYDVYGSTKKIEAFIDNLSNWYIRENRDRFWKNENDSDKEQAYQVLYTILRDLSKLMAPFTPFLSEEIYRNLTGKESVHLADWPEVIPWLDNDQTSGLIEHMRMARESVSVGLRLRAITKKNLRQPLEVLVLPAWQNLDSEWVAIIAKALNVKTVTNDSGILNDLEYVTEKTSGNEVVALKITLTPELKLEGGAREIIRAIQEGRKKAGFSVEDRIMLGYNGKEKVFANAELKEMIQKEILATTDPTHGDLTDAEYTETVKIEDEDFTFSLKR